MDDGRITELFNLRDETAISEANTKYGAYCHTVAFNILGDKNDAEETVSDALFKAWQAIPPAKPKSLGAFLAKITRNSALNKLERDTAKKRGNGEIDYCVPSDHCTEASSDARRLGELINKFLGLQSREYRIVFLKRYWYMMPISEIAKDLGFTESKVKTALMRTRNALKEFLEREDFSV